MLKLLTAWEENMPMMEKAIEKFLFSALELSADIAGDTHIRQFALSTLDNSAAHVNRDCGGRGKYFLLFRGKDYFQKAKHTVF